MSGKPRPRGVCPRCKKSVALYLSGVLWDHCRPGWGIWDDGDPWCPGSKEQPGGLIDWRVESPAVGVSRS